MKNMGENLKEEMAQRNWQSKYKELIGDSINDPDVQTFLREHFNEITEENLQRSTSRIYEFVQEKNKINNGIDSFAKGYFPRLTINNNTVDVLYQPDTSTIEKNETNKFKKKFKLIDLPSDIRDADLTEYPLVNKNGRARAFAAANKFLENYFLKDVFTPGIYLSGDFGVGKTYLLGAIANVLAQKSVDVTLVHFPTFAVDMKASIGDNSVLSKVEKLKKVSILMIDDIGADSVSAWIRDEILGVILQYRMQEEIPTFFSSNFSMDDLEKHLSVSKSSDEPVKAKRIMERVRFLSREIIVSGENQRLKNQIEY